MHKEQTHIGFEQKVIEKVAIIGIGLIGSSLARAIKIKNISSKLALYDTDINVRNTAEDLQLGDICPDVKTACKGADLVILSVPVGSMADVLQNCAEFIEPGAILTDVGSVKAMVISTLQPILPAHIHLIPGHPIAGTEYSGPKAGFASLFENRWCILTPLEDMSQEYQAALSKLTVFWQAIGSRVECMKAEQHDIILAMTSHIPHLIAFNIVQTAADLEAVSEREVVKYSAGGFRDFTRIAASDPIMWRDVFLHNKEAVLEILGRFSEDLISLQRAIRWDEGDKLLKQFTRAKDIRQSIIDAGQDTAVPDFGRGKQK